MKGLIFYCGFAKWYTKFCIMTSYSLFSPTAYVYFVPGIMILVPILLIVLLLLIIKIFQAGWVCK